jgi:tetratricopeptide (TPR) repeat protein
MFEFQDRSATKIAALIDSTVRTLEIGRSSNLPEERMDVRQLYYRAIGILRTNDRRILPDGARCLERLLQVEPDHVHALGLAATIYLNMWQVGLAEDDSEAIRLKALDRASSALGLAMDDHWAVGLASMTLAWAGDQVEASVTQLDRILSMAPSFAIAWFWSGFVRIRAGDPTAAIAHLERAMEFDPRTPVRPTMLGYLGAARVANGDDAEALRILNQAIALRPHWTTPRIFSAIALAHLGRVEEARRQLALSEHHAPVAKFRWPTRDASQRERLCDGLTRAGAPHAKPVFADI